MGWQQVLFGIVLVVLLLGVAAYFARRELALLRQVPPADDEDTRFKRSLAPRRLVNSCLIGLLGILLAGALVFLENTAQNLADRQDARERAGEDTHLSGKDLVFARTYGIFWIVFGLVLLTCVLLAGADLWAIRRYSVRQHQKLREARRAMIERETARLREERHGSDDVLRN